MLRTLFWAAWWPTSTWLLAVEKATAQANEAMQRQTRAADRAAKDGPRPEPKPREDKMANEPFGKMEMPDTLRDLMKMGIEQARYAFETFAANSEKALRSFETSSAAARDSIRSLNDKIAEITRKNAEANFTLAMKLAEAKDFNQALAMQSQHIKTQMETFASQIQEIRDLAAKVIQENKTAAQSAPPSSGAAPGFGSGFGTGFGGPGNATPGGGSGNSA
jgi:phasin